jgi:endoglucanase
MAYALLKAQQAPRLVSRLVLNASKNKAETTDNCEIKELDAADQGAKFQLLEKALPFPVPAEATPALELVPFTAELNQQLLVVKGLAVGNVALTIDGQAVGNYAAADLAAGVNLATNPGTPQYRQAVKVMEANAERARLDNDILRPLAYTRHFILTDYKGDWADTKALLAAVEAKQKTYKEGDYSLNMCQFFRQHYPRIEEYRRQVADGSANLYQINQPTWHRYELRRQP